jgi:hypothetical protein
MKGLKVLRLDRGPSALPASSIHKQMKGPSRQDYIIAQQNQKRCNNSLLELEKQLGLKGRDLGQVLRQTASAALDYFEEHKPNTHHPLFILQIVATIIVM